MSGAVGVVALEGGGDVGRADAFDADGARLTVDGGNVLVVRGVPDGEVVRVHECGSSESVALGDGEAGDVAEGEAGRLEQGGVASTCHDVDGREAELSSLAASVGTKVGMVTNRESHFRLFSRPCNSCVAKSLSVNQTFGSRDGCQTFFTLCRDVEGDLSNDSFRSRNRQGAFCIDTEVCTVGIKGRRSASIVLESR